MQTEKWQQLTGRILDEFKVAKHETAPGAAAGEIIETLIFFNPAGKMKLERSVKPKVLGEKTYYSGRVGSTTGIEKIYSETEMVDNVKLWREQAGQWIEIDARTLE